MAVGQGKSRTLLDRRVKKEVRDRHPYDDPQVSRVAGRSATKSWQGEELEDDDNLTLANWFDTPPRMSPSTMDKRNKMVENQYKLLNIPKRPMDSTTNQVVSDQAQRFTSSVKGSPKRVSSPSQGRSSAVIRAEAVRSKLDPKFPSFVKSLVRSHVAGCFWMGLPVLFCKRNLPDKDTTITLEDETSREYQSKFIAYKTGLSAGWRQFAVVHKLLEGDVLVFQLVETTKFKVYIIRANGPSELDGQIPYQTPDSYAKRKSRDNPNVDHALPSPYSPKRKHIKPDSSSPSIQKKKKTNLSRFSPKVIQSAEPSEYDSDEAHSETLDGFATMIHFKDIKSFENFTILINGMQLDPEFPHEVRNKYYKLCHSQNAFLHDNLIKGINYNLIVGIIFEVVSIADSMRSSSLFTSPEEFAKWDEELIAFQHMGMNVEFLRQRLHRLVNVAYKAEEASETRQYLAARNELTRADDEIMNIEAKLEDLKGACDDFGVYLESLKHKAERYHHKFEQEVTAPW